ncbi:MAG TPA: hypothetical protein VK190_03130 [Pseudoneobacillus sp.]|jgi:hypothetical protein|nr:hypothetical protein [Pseudoneobacillus sp.]
MTDITKILQQYFPRWMEIRTNDDSVGVQFLEVFGLKLTDVKQYLDDMIDNFFIGTANVGEVDIVYKVSVEEAILSIVPTVIQDNDFNEIEITDRLQTFYQEVKDIAIIDYETSIVYFRKLYPSVQVNGMTYYQEEHNVWNVFDEFGMLLNVYRLPGEKNEDFKNRILDIFKAPPGDTKGGLTNHLSRVLGIDKSKIEISSLAELSNTEIDIDGNISPKFLSYVKNINKLIPFTWDTIRWDEGYWDMFSGIGLDYLPHIYNPDTSMWKQEDFQSGIGDNDDLLIEKPVIEPEEQNFDYEVGLTGTIDRAEDIYVEHALKYKVYATGKKINPQDMDVKRAYYTVVASEDVPFTYDVQGKLDYVRTINEDFTAGPYTFSKNASTNTPTVEIVHGNKIMSPNNRKLQVKIMMDTNDPALTPTLKSLTIRWINTSGAVQATTINTAEGFTRNDPTSTTSYPSLNTSLNSTQTTAQNTVTLGKGSYSRYYDTINSWKDGTRQNTKPTRAGLTMVLPNERV